MRRMRIKAAPNVAQGLRGTSKEQSVPTKDSSEKTFLDKKDDTWDNCHGKGELESLKFIQKKSIDDDEVMKNNDETYSEKSDTDIHKKSSELLLNVLEKESTDNSFTKNRECTEKEEHVNLADINEKICLPDESKVKAIDDRPDLCSKTLFQSTSSPPKKINADVTLSIKRQELTRRKKTKVTPVFNKIKKENLKNCLERMNESIHNNVISLPVNNKTDADSIVEQTDDIENDISITEKNKIEVPFVEKISENVEEKVQKVGKFQSDKLDIRENQNIKFDGYPLKDLSSLSMKGSTRRSKIRTVPTLLTSKKKIKLEKETIVSNGEYESRDDYSKKENKKGKNNEGSLKLEYESCCNKTDNSSVKDYDNFVTNELNLKESGETLKSDKYVDVKSKDNMENIKDMASNDEILKDGEGGRVCHNIEEDEVKTVFRERKNEYHKKIREGTLERKEMTMFDLIFYNPQNNPMPGPSKDKKKISLDDNGNEGDISETQREEEMVDDIGLEEINTEDNQNVNSLELTAIDNPSEENKDDLKVNNGIESDCEDNVLGPKLKIGLDGEIIIDEQSLVIKTTAAKEKDLIMSNSILVEENNDNIHYGRHNKKRRRSCEWTIKETARFYKALSTVGTDFSLMESLFTWRSRAELKTKFKKEERKYRKLVERALQDDKQFDFTIFDESDYDPEEDRKSVKIEERKEAKRKKKERKETKIKMCEIKKKKVVAEKKNRKSILKKVFKHKAKGTKRGKRKEVRKYKQKEQKSEDSSNSVDEADVECNVRNSKSSKISKKKVPKRKVNYCKKSRVITSNSSSDEEDVDNEDKKNEIQSDVRKYSKTNNGILSDDITPSNCNMAGVEDTDQWIEQAINSPMPSREAVDLISENLLSKVDTDYARGTSSVIDQGGRITSNDSMENLNKASIFNVSNDTVSEHIRVDEDASETSSVIDQGDQITSNDSLEILNKASTFNVGNDTVIEHIRVDEDASETSSVIDQGCQITSNDSLEILNKASIFNVGNGAVSEHIRVDEDLIPHSENIMCEEAVMKANLGTNKTMKCQSGNVVPDCDSLLQSCVVNKMYNKNFHDDLPLERTCESLTSNNTKSGKSTEIITNEDKRSKETTIDSLTNNIQKTTLVENLVDYSNNIKFADEITSCEKANVYDTHGKDLNIGQSSKGKTNMKKTEEKTIKDETEKIKDYNYQSSKNAGNNPTKASVWHPQKFPVSAIITDLEGNRHIKVTTEQGSLKQVPVPRLPSGTSSIVVVASISTQGTEVYHVFAVAPPCNNGS